MHTKLDSFCVTDLLPKIYIQIYAKNIFAYLRTTFERLITL